MRIPGPTKQFSGMHPGNYGGNVWQTFNIDLEKRPGRIVLSDKLRRYVSGLGVVHKFLRSDALATDQWFGLVRASTSSATDGDILRNGNTNINGGTWITDDTDGAGDTSPNNVHDMVIHESANGEQRLLVTTATDIAVLNSAAQINLWDNDWGSTIATGGIALQNTVFHPIARLQRLVAVGDKTSANVPVIHTVDKNNVFSASRLTFDAVYTVRLILVSSNRFWIGLQHNLDGLAKIIEWDGVSLTYNNEYELSGSYPLVGFVVNDVPYFITEKGLIFRYTGGGFSVVQDFNIQEERIVFSPTFSSGRTIADYGACVDGDIVYLNVGAPTVISTGVATGLSSAVRRARAGIWIFNTKNKNLYHHMGIGEHATADTDVNYGTSPLAQVGAVLKSTVGNDQILIASASVYTGGATWLAGSTNGIYRMIRNTDQDSNAGRNRGYFITPFIPISEAEAMWEALWVKFKRFVNSNNRIVVKWRVLDPLFNASAADPGGAELELMTAAGTWVSTTTFTCTVPTGVSVGDEVEILTGDNAGCSFKVSVLSATPDNTTAITVTIAEAAPTSSTDTFLCRFDNFNTETAISSTSVGSQKVPFTAPAHGEFIQLKVELRGFGVEIDELVGSPKVKTFLNQT